ncbi:UBP-type zinc finger domain-containing protein [Terrabacter lapilli]|uniref:UBP-type zinc finger domain-containing protein n=1 Tax=Terrabacter lapilli TaxID=436231 RepID=A0ABN2RM00_9MICO
MNRPEPNETAPGDDAAINLDAPPSGDGCRDCEVATPPGWWLHLRRCTACGHIGCCDSSPRQHASAHFRSTGHPVIQSYEPGEDWFYDYRTAREFAGPALPAPTSHPATQPTPGPSGRVPLDWRRQLH